MKQNFYKVRSSLSAALTQQITASNRFQTAIAFLRKELGSKPNESLVRSRYASHRLSNQYLYINASFSPSPDDTVASLYKVRRSYGEARLTAAVLRDGQATHRQLQVRRDLAGGKLMPAARQRPGASRGAAGFSDPLLPPYSCGPFGQSPHSITRPSTSRARPRCRSPIAMYTRLRVETRDSDAPASISRGRRSRRLSS